MIGGKEVHCDGVLQGFIPNHMRYASSAIGMALAFGMDGCFTCVRRKDICAVVYKIKSFSTLKSQLVFRVNRFPL